MGLSNTVVAALGVLALCGCATAEAPAKQAAEFVRAGQNLDTVSVTTTAGELVGIRKNGVRVFRGVAYAQAPVGDLRWAETQPVKPWVGQRAAIAAQSTCPQPVPGEGLPNGGGVVGAQSEDCLYLDVFAPANARKAPVVVWLHGGAAFLGAGSLGSYNGTENAKKGVITVPINYRLGPLGYFAHPSLTAEGGATGSFGMMDAVEALEWVQANIKSFGGDPNNVTIAGQSAGGLMVVDMLSTASAKGLFDKAVVQSGAILMDGSPLAKAEASAIEGLAMLGVGADATASEIRSISPQTLTYNAKLRRGLGPILDGEFRDTPTKAAVEAGTDSDVPVLVGSNGGEGGFDRARSFARLVGEQGAKAFLYHFDYVPALRTKEWTKGPIHSAEMMFTFDSMKTSGWAKEMSDADDAAYAKRVSSCWVAFYKMDPRNEVLNCADGLRWTTHSEGSDAVAVFAKEISMGASAAFPDGPSASE